MPFPRSGEILTRNPQKHRIMHKYETTIAQKLRNIGQLLPTFYELLPNNWQLLGSFCRLLRTSPPKVQKILQLFKSIQPLLRTISKIIRTSYEFARTNRRNLRSIPARLRRIWQFTLRAVAPRPCRPCPGGWRLVIARAHPGHSLRVRSGIRVSLPLSMPERLPTRDTRPFPRATASRR